MLCLQLPQSMTGILFGTRRGGNTVELARGGGDARRLLWTFAADTRRKSEGIGWLTMNTRTCHGIGTVAMVRGRLPERIHRLAGIRTGGRGRFFLLHVALVVNPGRKGTHHGAAAFVGVGILVPSVGRDFHIVKAQVLVVQSRVGVVFVFPRCLKWVVGSDRAELLASRRGAGTSATYNRGGASHRTSVGQATLHNSLDLALLFGTHGLKGCLGEGQAVAAPDDAAASAAQGRYTRMKTLSTTGVHYMRITLEIAHGCCWLLTGGLIGWLMMSGTESEGAAVLTARLLLLLIYRWAIILPISLALAP